MTKEIKTAGELDKALSGYIGTGHYYVLWTGARLKYTDGVRELASLAGAYWLLELLELRIQAIYAKNPKLRDFALISVKSQNCQGAVDILTDSGEENKEISYPLEYTDFPAGVFEMYLIDGVLLLKSEY